jgi:hypothetical protein
MNDDISSQKRHLIFRKDSFPSSSLLCWNKFSMDATVVPLIRTDLAQHCAAEMPYTAPFSTECPQRSVSFVSFRNEGALFLFLFLPHFACFKLVVQNRSKEKRKRMKVCNRAKFAHPLSLLLRSSTHSLISLIPVPFIHSFHSFTV